MLSPNHEQADRTATAILSGSVDLIRWVGVFVCFGVGFVCVLDYSEKEESLILLTFFL